MELTSVLDRLDPFLVCCLYDVPKRKQQLFRFTPSFTHVSHAHASPCFHYKPFQKLLPNFLRGLGQNSIMFTPLKLCFLSFFPSFGNRLGRAEPSTRPRRQASLRNSLLCGSGTVDVRKTDFPRGLRDCLQLLQQAWDKSFLIQAKSEGLKITAGAREN